MHLQRPIVYRLAQPCYGTAGQPNCVFGQMTNLTGHWVNNSSPSFHGFYNASSDCPDYINEFDCQNPQYYVRGQPTGEESSILHPSLRTLCAELLAGW